jgi:hypothetical protein
MREDSGQAGALEIEITSAMIEAGVAVLRAEFGGETEGANRFVDFPEVVDLILRKCLDQVSSQIA